MWTMHGVDCYRFAVSRVSQRIPCLDGLRGISILLVVVGHWLYAWARYHSGFVIPLPLRSVARNGVTLFFGISGFLITTLLLSDYARFGAIRLKSFYLRRGFRILPAFWFYLLLIALVTRPRSPGEFGSAMLFLTDYLFPHNGYLAHTWSLSIEEQFYLLWPLTLSLAGPKRGLKIAAVVVILTPFMRLATYLAFPHAQQEWMLHTRIDAIMCGSFIALLVYLNDESPLLRLLQKPWVAAIAAVVFMLSPLGDNRIPYYWLLVAFSVESVAAGVIVWYAISAARGFALKVLSLRPLVHIGLISYSLYLWQQAFWLPLSDNTFGAAYPFGLFLAFGMAELSYYAVEKPMLRLRKRVVDDSEPVNWATHVEPAL